MSHPVALAADMMRSSSFDTGRLCVRFNLRYKVAKIFANQGKVGGKNQANKWEKGKKQIIRSRINIYGQKLVQNLFRTSVNI